MEIVVYGVLTSVWWMSSLTVFLPFLFLLKFSKFFRDKFFSYIFLASKVYFEPKLIPFRKKAFELLKDSLSQRDASKPLKVLEIGIGSGANFEYYPENSHLTALDRTFNFDTYFTKNKEKYANIKYEKTVISVAENMKDINDSSMDVVISTYVLCSVTSIDDVVKEVKRVLKPGGKFLFLDHVGHPSSGWGYTVQKFADPLWSLYCGGCHLVRKVEDNIKNAGFSHVICERIFPQSVILFIRPQLYGLATK